MGAENEEPYCDYFQVSLVCVCVELASDDSWTLLAEIFGE